MMRLMALVVALAGLLVGCGDSGGFIKTPPCEPVARPDLDGALYDPCEGSVVALENNALKASEYGGDGAPITMSWYIDPWGGGALYPTHIVVRGMYTPNSIRCENDMVVRYAPYTELSDYTGTTGFGWVRCYADIAVHEYIVGEGPNTLTALVAKIPPHWSRITATDEEVETELRAMENVLLEGTYSALLRGVPEGGIEGIESIFFLSPNADVSVESWLVSAPWDIERQDDGTIIAVHPHRDHWKRVDYDTHRSAIEMSLSDFKESAQAEHEKRVDAYGGKVEAGDDMPALVTNANEFYLWYSQEGVLHAEGPPTEVPPPACGLAVPDPANNGGLMLDCATLLGLKGTLRGTGTLNWSVDVAMADWDGVRTRDTGRVTNITLVEKGLTGTVPSQLAQLSNLEKLALSSNALTGEIPSGLGSLSNLEILWLSHNQLTGNVPSELGNLSALEKLTLSNKLLTGAIPTELGELTDTLTELRMANNAFTGCILGALRSQSPPTTWTGWGCGTARGRGPFDKLRVSGVRTDGAPLADAGTSPSPQPSPSGEGAIRLVLEVADAGGEHGDACGVGGGDDLGVADGATGVDDGGDAALRRRFDAVREGEHGIGGHDAAMGAVAGGPQREVDAGDAVGLPCPHADHGLVGDQDDGVGLDVFHDPPGVGQVGPLLLGGLALCDDRPGRGVFVEVVGGLEQGPAGDAVDQEGLA